MGKLRPIGSEKLEGMAKINRMIEIAKYKENKPSRINEDSSNEYSVRLADGHKYHIIKEKNGYVIKKGLNESVSDYIEPLKNRKYYSSYSQALKRLNLITKEVNISEGIDKNLSLFTEGEEGEKKYFLSLKRSTNEQAPPTAPAPAPAPVPAPAPAPVPAPAASPAPEGEVGMSPEDEMMGLDDTEMTPPEDEMTPEGTDETVTFKTIQKLTGKLGQKLRTLNSDEENAMSSKDIKYVINSILSALDLNNLEDDDKEEIMTKFEGGETEGMEEPDMGDEEMTEPSPEGEEVSAEAPQAPVQEYDSIDEEDYEEDNFMMEYDEIEEETSCPSGFNPVPSKHTMNQNKFEYTKNFKCHKLKGNEENQKMEEMIEGIFSESKVDKVLKTYFKLDKKEKQLLENKNKVNKKIETYSSTISQKVASKKFINENKNAEFLGVSNLGNLVFKQGNKEVKINNKGQII